MPSMPCQLCNEVPSSAQSLPYLQEVCHSHSPLHSSYVIIFIIIIIIVIGNHHHHHHDCHHCRQHHHRQYVHKIQFQSMSVLDSLSPTSTHLLLLLLSLASCLSLSSSSYLSSSSPSWLRKQEEERVFIHNPPNMRLQPLTGLN